jgi:hypothetical protein
MPPVLPSRAKDYVADLNSLVKAQAEMISFHEAWVATASNPAVKSAVDMARLKEQSSKTKKTIKGVSSKDVFLRARSDLPFSAAEESSRLFLPYLGRKTCPDRHPWTCERCRSEDGDQDQERGVQHFLDLHICAAPMGMC